MKRILPFRFSILVIAALFSGCAAKEEKPAAWDQHGAYDRANAAERANQLQLEGAMRDMK